MCKDGRCPDVNKKVETGNGINNDAETKLMALRSNAENKVNNGRAIALLLILSSQNGMMAYSKDENNKGMA